MRQIGINLILSFYYRAMIPKEVLDIPELGHTISTAHSSRNTGGGLRKLGSDKRGKGNRSYPPRDDRIRRQGKIIAQKSVPINFEDTAHDVFLKVTEASREILLSSLPSLENGTAKRYPQDESKATKFGRRRPEDGDIDWNRSADEIYNFVRALTHPFPGAFTHWQGNKFFIWKALPVEGTFEPGKIKSESPMLVGTGSGLLRVLRIQPEGEPERDA